MASTTTATKEQVQGLIERCFVGMTQETEGYAHTFVDPEYELHEQRRMIEERLTALRCQIASGTFDEEVQAASNRLLEQHGLGTLPPGLMRDLSEGVARALAEQQRLYRVSADLVVFGERFDLASPDIVEHVVNFAGSVMVASAHASFHNHFSQERHLISRQDIEPDAQPPWPSGNPSWPEGLRWVTIYTKVLLRTQLMNLVAIHLSVRIVSPSAR